MTQGDGDWRSQAEQLAAMELSGYLFLCVANSARSQIAEGVARMLAPTGVCVQSAGSHPSELRPEAAAVLAERGIDTSTLRSKSVREIAPETVDVVITLCAEEECPIFLGDALRIHWGLPDPAAVTGSLEDRLAAFRAIRDELERRLRIVFLGARAASVQ